MCLHNFFFNSGFIGEEKQISLTYNSYKMAKSQADIFSYCDKTTCYLSEISLYSWFFSQNFLVAMLPHYQGLCNSGWNIGAKPRSFFFTSFVIQDFFYSINILFFPLWSRNLQKRVMHIFRVLYNLTTKYNPRTLTLLNILKSR